MQNRQLVLMEVRNGAEQEVWDTLPEAIRRERRVSVSHDPGRNLTTVRIGVTLVSGGRPEGEASKASG